MALFARYRPAIVSRIFFACAAVAPAWLTQAQTGAEITVSAVRPRVEVLQPSVQTAAFRIENTGARERTVSSRLRLPPGWITVLRESDFNVPARRAETRLVSFSMPQTTPAGSYRLTYQLIGRATSDTVATATMDVIVVASKKVEVRLGDIPRFVAAGSEYSISYFVSNTGNVAGTFKFTAKNSSGFHTRLDAGRMPIGIGQSHRVLAFVRTPSRLREKTVSTLELEAIMESDSSVAGRASGIVDIIPQDPSAEDDYHLYPLRITGRAAGEDERLAGQMEASGSGALSSDKRDLLEVFVRSPDVQSQSSLGLRDEYRVKYTSKLGELKLGDWSYSLSPLTELSRYGFGGEGAARFAGVTVGGFYNESRFSVGQKQVAGYAKYEVADGSTVGVNHLRKVEQRTSTISSIRGEVIPLDRLLIDVEVAASKSDAGADRALSARLRAQYPWGGLDTRVVNAGPDFEGYFRDVNHGSIQLNVSPGGQIHGDAYFRSERRNKNNDTTLFYVPHEQYLQVGGGYSDLVALYYRYTRQEDLLPVPQYRRTENAAQLRLGYTISGVSLHSNIEAGSASDQLVQKDFPFQRYALYAGFSPTPSQQYNLSSEFSTENNLFSGEKLDRLSIGVAGSLFLANETNILGSFYWSRLLGGTQQEFGLIDVTLRHEFPNRHQIAVRTRQNFFVPAVRTRELAFQLQYSIPIAIPVHRVTSSGRLTGRVLDEDGKGLANVVVHVGPSAVLTNSRGEFTLHRLSRGTHYLTIDRASLGLERVTMQPLPLEFEIQDERETRTLIRTARGCIIAGVVNFSTFADAGTGEVVVDQGGKPGILVEATNGTELHRRLTDSRGRFSFAELKPGRWIVRVVGDVPLYHFVEQDVYEPELRGGERKEITFRIVPRKRTVKIIQIQEAPVVLTPSEPTPDEERCLISYDPQRRGYVLQVSSWATYSKASERAVVAQHVTGKKATIEKARVSGVGIRYRVKVGLFLSRTEAELHCRKLQTLENEPAHD